MDITTATPVEIDTVIAEIYVRFNVARYETARQQGYLDQLQETLDQVQAGTYRWGGTVNIERTYPARIAALEAKVAECKAAAMDILAEAAPYNAEWVRRGRWSRFYLVDNGSGHVHSSMDCSTTFPTTEWVWLPEYSDQDEAGVVALAKSQACTICFPSAPPTREKGSIMSPAKRKSAQERAEAKAEREAKKAAKAIANPDGSPLSVFDWHVPERQYRNRLGDLVIEPARDRFETITTLAAAKMWLTDSQEVTMYRTKRREDVQRVAEAIAHKVGTDAETEIQAAAKRAAKRK